MKTICLCIILFNILTYGQPWNYNFGTATGSFNTLNTPSTIFLPDPPSGGGADARVRVGTTGGSFNLENQVISFGTESYLRTVAPTSSSVNKFSVYDYSAAPLFTLRFSLRFGAADGSATGATSGTWYLFIGDGATYSDNNSFNGAQVFTGLRFIFGASGSITTSARVGSAWTATGITGTPFSQGNNYLIDIYGNNSSIVEAYNYTGIQTVDPNTMDIWVNGVLVADNLGKAGIANNVNVDSWMFYGENSASNVANIFLDDFYYTNELANNPLPVELTSFSAAIIGKDVKLNWATETEINNYGFEIERKMGSSQSSTGSFEKIGFVNGNGNSSSPKNYSFADDNVSPGRYSYKLKQIDNDGKFEYSKVIEIDFNSVRKIELNQNYPNPFNPTTTIQFQLPQTGWVKLTLYNILGQEIKTLVNEVKEAGTHTVNLDAVDLNSGVYIYRIESGSYTQTQKMTLIK